MNARPAPRKNGFGKAFAVCALSVVSLWLWQCKFPVMREPTTLLDVTLVDSLAEENGYEKVSVEVFDGEGNRLITAFDKAYKPAVHGTVLRDIDLGTSPPDRMEIRITGFRTDGRTVVFVKKIANGTAEKAWTQAKGLGPGPGPGPDGVATLAVEPGELYLWVESVAVLDVDFRSRPGDSLVWVSGDPQKAAVLDGNRVKGVSPGAATITVSSTLKPSVRDSVIVRVSRRVDSVSSIRLDPRSMTLYTGGASRVLSATILPPNPDNQARFTSLAGDIAEVDANGTVKGLRPGRAAILAYPVGHAHIFDSCVATVKTDKPVVDAGPARKVDLDVAVPFTVRVTQEYGGVAALKWDLDGDGAWEDSVLGADSAKPSFRYSAARPYKARFQARDGEGNVDSAIVNVVAGGNAPVVDITRPGRDTVVNTPTFRLEYLSNSVPRARTVTLEYGTHKVGVSDTVAGEIGTDSVVITLDTLPPQVIITSPMAGAATRASSIPIAWMVDSVIQSDRLSESLAGRQGAVPIVREAFDLAGNRGADTVIVVRDTVKPKVAIVSPRDGDTVYKTTLSVKWTVDNQVQAQDTVETLPAGEGPKTIVRHATDAAGNRDSTVITVTLARLVVGKPVLIASETTPSPTRKDTLAWTIGSGGNGNGVYRYGTGSGNPTRTTGKIAGNYTFTFPAPTDGLYTFKAQEGDDQGGWSELLIHSIAVDRTAPKVTLAGGDRTVTADTFTVTATIADTGAGAVGLAGFVQLTGTKTGNLVLGGGKYSLKLTLATGLNTLTVTAMDSAGNLGSATLKITYDPNLPPFKALLFNKPLGFDHAVARAASTNLIVSDLPTLLNAAPQFTVDTTRDTADLNAAKLAGYDVLILNHPSGLNNLNAGNRTAINDFANVKGLVVIHGSVEQAWPEFASMMGGLGSGHTNGTFSGTVNNAAASHWLNTGLPATATLVDEWHGFNPNPASVSGITTLWTLDESSVAPSSGLPQMGANHPVAWCRTLTGGGRFFHTALGHDGTNFTKTGMLGRMLYNALVWTAKRDR